MSHPNLGEWFILKKRVALIEVSVKKLCKMPEERTVGGFFLINILIYTKEKILGMNNG
jgi:hypothetical protein